MLGCACNQHVQINARAQEHINRPDQAAVAGLSEIVCSLHGNTLTLLTRRQARLTVSAKYRKGTTFMQKIVEHTPLPRDPKEAMPLPHAGLACDLCSGRLNMAWQLWNAPATILQSGLQCFRPTSSLHEPARARRKMLRLRCAVTPASMANRSKRYLVPSAKR